MRLLTLKTVLVATDLDGSSEAALRTAARLASLAGAELHLLHVASEPKPDDEARVMELFARSTPEAPEIASVQVLAGTPAAVIVEQATDLEADAVVLGPHRPGRTSPDGLGSTAAQVVRTVPCPCLLAATELSLPMGTVLAAVDLSDAATATLAVALSWASALRPRQGRARLTALHVALDATTQTAAGAIHEKVQRTRSEAGEAAHVDFRERIATSQDPAATILDEAAAESADLLVIGTRGAGQASALGRVSAAIASTTTCPLLLVPPDIPDGSDSPR